MLYQIGAVTLDTAPFNADEADHSTAFDLAAKPVIGAMQRREAMGEGDEELVISGQILPSAIGGLTELDTIDGFRASGKPVPVMRGDGKMLGWFAITKLRREHSNLERTGVGFVVQHQITMVKTGPEGADTAIIPALLSLFGVLGR